MANPITFYSQSAHPSVERKGISKPSILKSSILKPLMLKYRKPLTLFLGDVKSEFMEFGEKLGFFCILYGEKSDPSYVVQAKVVIVQNADFNFIKQVELINMAVNYGIPTVWVHSILPPGRWMWSSRYSLVGFNVRPVDVWRKICQEVM